MTYVLTCGLETHVELATKTKLFCSCPTTFGSPPNTLICPTCSAEPGSLPIVNKQAFIYAIKAGLATGCKIHNLVHFDRKNYTYPDLPKAYQTTQFSEPICTNGQVILDSGKAIRIDRIHLEEDAGKLIHKGDSTYIDYNRGAVPLIEIVTKPDINSVDEAREYLEKLQLILRHIAVSDCKMEEGSMRCDVNISVKKSFDSELGVRTEIKNMNSLSFIEKAIESEYERQVNSIEGGEKIIQETRRYNELDNSTSPMREKEDALDYRYQEDPDIPSIFIAQDIIDCVKKSMPRLPQDIKSDLIMADISPQDTNLIVKYKKVADFFVEAMKNGDPKLLATYVLGEIFRQFTTEAEKEAFDVPISPSDLAKISILQREAKINAQIAKRAINQILNKGLTLEQSITKDDLAGIDDATLTAICKDAISKNQNAVNDFLAGKEKALMAIVGQVMKATRGKANAQLAEKIILNLIKK